MQLFKRLVIQITLVTFMCSGLSLPANAAVLTTEDYLSATARTEQLQTIDAALAREDVRQQLLAMGVEPEQALQRIALLSDEDLATLAAEMEELPAGGSVLAVIGIVFVVLMILELTGVINIFNNF